MILLIFVVFAGSLINTGDIPAGLGWIQYISPATYSYKGITQNEFDGLEFDCPQSDVDSELPCFKTGEQVLQYYDLTSVSIWTSLILLWVMLISLHVIGYILMRFKTRSKGKML